MPLRPAICIALLTTMPCFCQNSHEPTPDELKILGAAAVAEEFNSSGGFNLRTLLLESEERQALVGSVACRAWKVEARSNDPSDWIRPATCAAAVVALGKIVGRTSALSDNEQNVITLYNFQIQTLYKTKDSTLAGKTINVLRNGGTLITPEGIIRQDNANFPPLHIGSDYILFLRELPGTGGYLNADPDLDFSAPVPGKDGRVVSIKGAGRSNITFESISKFQDAFDKAQGACATFIP